MEEDAGEDEGPEPPKVQPEGPHEPSSSTGKLLIATRGSQVYVVSPCARSGGTFCRPPALQPTRSGTKGKTWVYFETPLDSIESVESLHASLRSQSCVQGAIVALLAPGVAAALLCKSRHHNLTISTSAVHYGFGRGRGREKVILLLKELLAADSYGDMELRIPEPPPEPMDVERPCWPLSASPTRTWSLCWATPALKSRLSP